MNQMAQLVQQGPRPTRRRKQRSGERHSRRQQVEEERQLLLGWHSARLPQGHGVGWGADAAEEALDDSEMTGPAIKSPAQARPRSCARRRATSSATRGQPLLFISSPQG